MVWYNGYWVKDFIVLLFFMNIGFEMGMEGNGKIVNMQIMGIYWVYMFGVWLFNGSVYYQFGKNKVDKKVFVYMFSLKVGYKIDLKWSVSLGMDYFSGDFDSKKVSIFDLLYGIYYKFYGGMDYFYVLVYNKGLWDKILSVDFKLIKKLSFLLNYYYFFIIYDVMVIDGKEGCCLGLELDMQVDYILMKDVKLIVGYFIMFGIKYMDIVKGGNYKSWQDWGWLILNINLCILFIKW